MIRKTILLSLLAGFAAPLVAEENPVYLVYYWRARPGKAAATPSTSGKSRSPSTGRQEGRGLREVHSIRLDRRRFD
jgi:hypothetical protein